MYNLVYICIVLGNEGYIIIYKILKLDIMNTSILDAILFDNNFLNNQEAALTDLEQMPEGWVNPLYSESSYDEMSEEERKEAVDKITDYIEANTTAEESRSFKTAKENGHKFDYDYNDTNSSYQDTSDLAHDFITDKGLPLEVSIDIGDDGDNIVRITAILPDNTGYDFTEDEIEEVLKLREPCDLSF